MWTLARHGGADKQAIAGVGQRRRLTGIHNLHDFERAARRHLPRAIFSYIANAAEDGKSLRDNTQSFDAYSFIPRVLVDVSRINQSTTLFGQQLDSPFGIAPMGLSALFTYRGDLALARAAGRRGIPMIMSGSSLIPLEEVAGLGQSTWFQAYFPAGRESIRALLERAEGAGFQHLVVTLDTPVATNPENNRRAGFSSPLRPSFRLAWDGITHPRWLTSTFLRTLTRHGMPHFENNYATRGSPIFSSHINRDISDRGHLDWDDMAFIRDHWPGRLILKSVLHSEDAQRAARLGVDGLIVSNHGGRQLDGAIAPLSVLPEIVQAAGELPVMVDSGFRRGTDVLKALALGARFVFVGRPFAYAAACAGEAGVEYASALLSSEIARDMALLGITDLSQLRAEHLRQLVPSHHHACGADNR